MTDEAHAVLDDLPESFWHVHVWKDGPICGPLDVADRLRIVKAILGEDDD